VSLPSRPRPTRSGLDPSPFLVGALLVVSALGVARMQPRLAATAHAAKENEDVYAFPPPPQMKALVFGYDAATVDLLWAKLLVDYGLHWHEKREFHPDPYLAAVAYLEPTYRPLYRFVDTLLCYHPLHATEADARKTRDILEAGTRARPWDFEVWQEYGQFSAFLGPGFLTTATNEEKDRWRHDGALALAKAVDLGAPAAGVLIASTLLGRAGETTAELEALQRAYAVNYDDVEMREDILRKIKRVAPLAQNDRAERALGGIDSLWRTDWMFLTHGEMLLVGPFPDPARCAGLEAQEDATCSRSWDELIAEPGDSH
jgi:hypothetical protein